MLYVLPSLGVHMHILHGGLSKQEPRRRRRGARRGSEEKAATRKTRVEVLTLDRVDEVRLILNGFIGHAGRGKRCCHCCIPCTSCPESAASFRKVYDAHPEALAMAAVAVREDTGVVIGAVVLNAHDVPRASSDAFVHTCQPGELHISWLAVSEGNRGMGAGSALMAWVKDVATERNANRITLEVAKGNPAKRLYERRGYQEVPPRGCGEVCCGRLVFFTMYGCPNGGCGAISMVKEL